MVAVHSTAVLELSPEAYDEIERKLLAAGYEHLFARGPGSLIDMQGLSVAKGEADEGMARGKDGTDR